VIAITEPSYVGIFAAAAIILSAIVAGLFSVSARKAIGKPNGHGNLVQMVTTVIEQIGSLKSDVSHVRDEQGRVKTQLVTTQAIVEAGTAESKKHYAEDTSNFADIHARLDSLTSNSPIVERE